MEEVLERATRRLETNAVLARQPEVEATLAAQESLAKFLRARVRKYEEAERLSRQTWQGRLQAFGSEDRDTLTSLDTYASVLSDQREFD